MEVRGARARSAGVGANPSGTATSSTEGIQPGEDQSVRKALPPLWSHQLEAVRRARGLPGYALFFEMGTGKTRTLVEILRAHINSKRAYLKTLILCPPIVVPNWREEILKYSEIPSSRVVPLYGSGAKRLETFRKETLKGGTIVVCNYESLLMGDLFEHIQAWGPEVLVLDESHKCKSSTTQRSKKAELLANPRGLPRPLVYLLSGTPVLNSPLDLFQQYKILDGGHTFTTNYFIFRARFFRDKNAGMPKARYFPDWVIRDGALDEINQLLQRTSMRVTKEECLDLPEEVAVTVKCEMIPEQARHYAAMKKDFLTTVGGGVATASLAIVKALRLMQITSGFLPMDHAPGEESDPEKHIYETTPKEEALRELLEQLTPHSKVLVWAVWKSNYGMVRKVCESLGIALVEVHGEVSESAKRAAVESFRNDPTVRVFLGHPGSGGIGINLTCAPYSIFLSRTFSLEQFLQARARNHRGGATLKVTHYDLVCTGTIDELVQNALAEKIDMSQNLLGDIARQISEQRPG